MFAKLLAGIFLFSVLLFSQPFGQAAKNFRIVKLLYQNSSGEKGTTFFKYDNSGKMHQSYWSLDNKKRSSVNHYQYNSKGILVSAFREFSDNLTSSEVFNYDENGNKLSESFYRSDSIFGEAFYEYENTKLKKATYTNYKGYLNGYINYYYENEHKRKNAFLFKDDKKICMIKYEYDSFTNLIKEEWDYFGKWKQTFTYVYEKINDNKKQYYSLPVFTNTRKYKIIKEEYTFNNEVGGPSIYNYDETNILDTKKFIRTDNVETITKYRYDKFGKLIESFRNYSDGSKNIFTYQYDEDDNLILRTSYKNEKIVGYESYFYDSSGQLKKAYYQNYDNWITGDIKFNYDETGKLTTGIFISPKGFSADIFFKYDKNECLSEIEWMFSFGKFQRYSFIYGE